MVLPGFPIPLPRVGADSGFTMTAGISGVFVGYINDPDGAEIAEGPIGSVTGNLSADGGTVTDVFFGNDGHRFIVMGGSGSLTTINIDGTDYTFTSNSTFGGYSYYFLESVATSLFTNGVTYSIEVT